MLEIYEDNEDIGSDSDNTKVRESSMKEGKQICKQIRLGPQLKQMKHEG